MLVDLKLIPKYSLDPKVDEEDKYEMRYFLDEYDNDNVGQIPIKDLEED